MKNGFLFCLASALIMISISAAAFDMNSINCKVSGDINSGSCKIILGIPMPEINDTFAATCAANSTSCSSQHYNFSGCVFSGRITGL